MTGGGRESTRPPRGPVPKMLAVQLAITAGAIVVQATGSALVAAPVLPLVCALLLVFGLPHGTLDLELLRRHDARSPRLIILLAAYGVCGGAMYALWQAAPLVALLAFFAIAVEHFAEDWHAMGSRFFAYGTAVALIVTPALRHRADLSIIFATLTGSSSAAHLGDTMLVVMPVAGLIAVAGAALLWQAGDRVRAVGLAAALVAEALLPPVIGFTIFFCCVHSPYQMRDSIARLQRPTRDALIAIILPLTLVAIALAGLIGAAALRVSLDAGALRASFVTLSVLTLPHMLVPYGVRRYRALALRAARNWRTDVVVGGVGILRRSIAE